MIKASTLNKNFYRYKRVFVTGHAGFKGAWATLLHKRNKSRPGCLKNDDIYCERI